MLPRLLSVAVLLLVLPASARAATIVRDGGTLTYTAGAPAPDPRNAVLNLYNVEPGKVSLIRVPGDDDGFDGSLPPGCTSNDPGFAITCDAVNLIRMEFGRGNDTVTTTGTGVIDEVLMGGDGDDELGGGHGTDTIDGGNGQDTLVAGGGTAVLDGGNGDDVLDGTAGANLLIGGRGIDRAEFNHPDFSGTFAASLDDIAGDGTGDDDVRSDVEDVTVEYWEGPAILIGNAAGNRLQLSNLRPGRLVGGAGSDTLVAEQGDDTIDARDGFADRVVCGMGFDTVAADRLDRISDGCENVVREDPPPEPPALSHDDQPPSVAWNFPARGAMLPAGAATTLVATATDDRGVAAVQFFDDERLICRDAAAPYACAYTPRTGDVGRNTLTARAIDTADQSTSAIDTVAVDRFRARRLTLRVSPTHTGFAASGRLRLPSSVTNAQARGNARVAITVTAGGKRLVKRRVALSKTGRYSVRVQTARGPRARLRVSARYSGNKLVRPLSAPKVRGLSR